MAVKKPAKKKRPPKSSRACVERNRCSFLVVRRRRLNARDAASNIGPGKRRCRSCDRAGLTVFPAMPRSTSGPDFTTIPIGGRHRFPTTLPPGEQRRADLSELTMCRRRVFPASPRRSPVRLCIPPREALVLIALSHRHFVDKARKPIRESLNQSTEDDPLRVGPISFVRCAAVEMDSPTFEPVRGLFAGRASRRRRPARVMHLRLPVLSAAHHLRGIMVVISDAYQRPKIIAPIVKTAALIQMWAATLFSEQIVSSSWPNNCNVINWFRRQFASAEHFFCVRLLRQCRGTFLTSAIRVRAPT
jgi:hypothetical protein